MHHAHLIPLILLVLMAATACSVEKRDTAARVSGAAASSERSSNSAPQEESMEALLKSQLARRTQEVGHLRLQLLAKQAEINQLLISHEQALQTAARANTRPRGIDNKADTVAAIAEAAVTIKNAREIAADEQQPALAHAEHLLETSRKEMQAGNLDTASFLAAKALQLAQLPQPLSNSKPADQSTGSEIPFVIPITMVTVRKSNVREMPEIGSKLLFQLAGGIEVKALGYKDLWLRIATEQGREGWIYYSLLAFAEQGTRAK